MAQCHINVRYVNLRKMASQARTGRPGARRMSILPVPRLLVISLMCEFCSDHLKPTHP